MLHITMSPTGKKVLEKSNLFNNDNIMSFCLILSYGNIKNIKKLKYKELEYDKENIWKVNINDKLNELEEKIKINKEIRIWYSNHDNEDVCNMCFLIYYLSEYKDLKIYLSEIGNGWGGLGAYHPDEIINLVDKKILLNDINKYKKLWIKLENENSDIRIYENNIINSCNFDYLDNKILKLLEKHDEIKERKLIAECMIERICNNCKDIIFKARIDYMIRKGVIKITKIKKERDIIDRIETVKYIKINEKVEYGNKSNK